jgi:hypothetical protein
MFALNVRPAARPGATAIAAAGSKGRFTGAPRPNVAVRALDNMFDASNGPLNAAALSLLAARIASLKQKDSAVASYQRLLQQRPPVPQVGSCVRLCECVMPVALSAHMCVCACARCVCCCACAAGGAVVGG